VLVVEAHYCCLAKPVAVAVAVVVAAAAACCCLADLAG